MKIIIKKPTKSRLIRNLVHCERASVTLIIACVAGAERGGKGEEIIRKREQRAYFRRILLSPGDCKNRDWSELLI